MRSGLPLVTGVYPLPTIDWDRVQSQPAGEDTHSWGVQYNVEPAAAGPGYVKAKSPESAKLGLAWIRKSAVEAVVRDHPDIATADGQYASLAVPGIVDGQRLSGSERFLRMYGKEVWVDVEHPASSSGPMEFGGCVGARHVLR
jgi:hypothetical protein